MAKTLADMTAEERADCIGLWTQLPHGQLAIIADTGTTHNSWLVFPRIAGYRIVYENKHVTPRYDLPRALTPDGATPVLEMAQALAEDSYEYIVQVHCEGRWQFYIGESIRPTDKPGLAVGFLQEKYAREFAKIETKRPTRIVRRRVSPPEVINERRCV